MRLLGTLCAASAVELWTASNQNGLAATILVDVTNATDATVVVGPGQHALSAGYPGHQSATPGGLAGVRLTYIPR